LLGLRLMPLCPALARNAIASLGRFGARRSALSIRGGEDILQRSDRERALATVWLRDVDPLRRLRPVGAAMNAAVQIGEVGLEIGPVVIPRHAVQPGRRIPNSPTARCGRSSREERPKLVRYAGHFDASMLCPHRCRRRASCASTTTRTRSERRHRSRPAGQFLGAGGAAAGVTALDPLRCSSFSICPVTEHPCTPVKLHIEL